MRPCGPRWMLACSLILAVSFQYFSLSTSLWPQYIGRIFATKTQRFVELMPLLLKRAGLPEGTKLSIYEEIKFDPSVMVDLQNPQHSLANAQLEDGDILCLQEEPSEVRPAAACLAHLLFGSDKSSICPSPTVVLQSLLGCHTTWRGGPAMHAILLQKPGITYCSALKGEHTC